MVGRESCSNCEGIVCGLSLQISSVHEAVALVRMKDACLLWTRHYFLCQLSKFNFLYRHLQNVEQLNMGWELSHSLIN